MSSFFNDWFFESGECYRDTELWLPVTDNDKYYICDKGYVMNAKTGRILKPHKGDIQGHENVRLSYNGKIKEKYIHRLVADRFIPNPKKLPIVRHLDGDVSNNTVSNLAWGTQKDNHDDSVLHNTARFFTEEDREKSYRLSRKPIESTNLNTGEKKYHDSENQAARDLNLQQANIFKVLKGQRKHTGGYSFKFVERR